MRLLLLTEAKGRIILKHTGDIEDVSDIMFLRPLTTILEPLLEGCYDYF